MWLGCTEDEPGHRKICGVNPFSHIFLTMACCHNGTRCNLNLSLHQQTYPVNHTGMYLENNTLGQV